MKPFFLAVALIVGFFTTTTAQNDHTQTNLTLTLFPNPATEVLEITSDIAQSTDLWFTVTSASGQIVRRELWKNNGGQFSRSVDVSGLSNGVYTVSVSDGKSPVFSKIIIYH